MRGSLEDMIFAFESKIDELENNLGENLKEDFPSHSYTIDLDKVIRLLNKKFDELSGNTEETYIEFDPDYDFRTLANGEHYMTFEISPADVTYKVFRGNLATKDDTIIVSFFKSGHKAICRDIDEIVDFMMDEISV